MKKLLSVLLAAALFATASLPAFAAPKAKAPTIEERINALELSPQKEPNGRANADWYDFSRVAKIRDNRKLSNYEKMQAVFLDIAAQTPGFSCTSHASLLGSAYEMLGFTVYGASGGVTTKSGKSPAQNSRLGFTKEGYTAHSWIAVEIDGEPVVKTKKKTASVQGESYTFDSVVLEVGEQDITLGTDCTLGGEILFFDLNLYATHGMAFERCFAVPPQNISWYIAIGVGNYY